MSWSLARGRSFKYFVLVRVIYSIAGFRLFSYAMNLFLALFLLFSCSSAGQTRCSASWRSVCGERKDKAAGTTVTGPGPSGRPSAEDQRGAQGKRLDRNMKTRAEPFCDQMLYNLRHPSSGVCHAAGPTYLLPENVRPLRL